MIFLPREKTNVLFWALIQPLTVVPHNLGHFGFSLQYFHCDTLYTLEKKFCGKAMAKYFGNSGFLRWEPFLK